MSHEVECPRFGLDMPHALVVPCLCYIAEAAYQRGREDERHDIKTMLRGPGHEFFMCCETHLREIADEAVTASLAMAVEGIRADERKRAALRVATNIRANNAVYDLGDTHIVDLVAAARGDGEQA